MKARIILVLMVALLFAGLVPQAGWSQLPKRVKKSNELTRSAIQSYKNHNITKAREQLNRALRLNPGNTLAHEIIALIYYQEHDLAAAKKHAQQARNINKKSPRALYVLGMINYQQGDRTAAKTQLQQALASLKDANYRQRAKSVLQKLTADRQEKTPLRSRTTLSDKKRLSKTDVSEQPSQQYQPYIAVFPIVDANARTERAKLGQTLTEMLITALIQTERFNVMERVQLEKILQEQSLSQSGAIDAETAVEVGKLSGLEGVVMGSISQLSSSIEADTRLIEVETGKALTAANARVKKVDDIRKLANSLARQLSAKAGLIAAPADTLKSEK